MPRSWLALVLVSSVSAEAGDWQRDLPAAAPTTPLIERVLVTGDGYRLVGRDAAGAVVWGQPDGDRLRWQPAALAGLAGRTAGLRSLHASAPGRHVGLVADAGGCRVASLDDAGALLALAAQPVAPCSPADANSDRFRERTEDAAGVVWDGVSRRARDGESLPVRLPPGSTATGPLSALRGAAGAYALVSRGDGDAGALTRLGAAGSQWEWRPDLADARLLAVATAADDDAWVVGRVAAGPGPGELFVARVMADGRARWLRRYPERGPVLLVERQVVSGDRLLLAVLPATGAPRQLHVLGRDGVVLWSQTLSAGETWQGFVDQPLGAAQAAAGPFAYQLGIDAAAFTPGSASVVDFRAADGRLLARLPPAPRQSTALGAVLADGSLVQVDRDGVTPAQALWRLDRDGRALAAPALARSLPTGLRQLASHVAADGDTFVLLGGGPQVPLQLAAYAADGRLRWNTPLSPASTQAVSADGNLASSQRPALSSNRERVCVGPLRLRVSQPFLTISRIATAVNCVRREDGALLLALDRIPDTIGELLPPIALREDNSLLLLEAACVECVTPRPLQRVVLDPLGEVQRRDDLQPAAESFLQRRASGGFDGVEAVASLQPDGSGLVVYSNTRRELLVQELPPIGQPARPSRTLAVAPDGVLVAQQRLADDVLLLHSWQGGLHRLQAFDANSRIRWQRDLAAPLDSADGTPFLLFAGAGDRVVTAEQVVSAGRRVGELRGLDARSGAVRWRQSLAAVDARGVKALAVDARGERLAWLADRPGALLVRALDLGDGRERGLRRLDCAQGACASAALHADADGGLRVVASRQLARVDLAAIAAAAPLRQAALRGTWYDPATDGQGLLVDLSLASGDLLGAWFTYAGDETVGVDGLRWFTLAGVVDAGAQRARLPLFRNANGRFDAPPVTGSVAVGEVELVLRGCNALQLSYRFGDGEFAGLSGTTVLQRLSPATADCIDADGSTVAASSPSTNAVASARAGAWFAPESAGQGLLFDLRPASADGRDPGLLLGGWFTYDPEGAADDPDAQHWFQLQGAPEGPGGDRQRAVILRASNGSLDARPTRNVQAVGEVNLQFTGCDRARLDYRFDDSGLAGRFAGRRGSIALIKLLPCAP